jgi:hypothetical protein
MMYKIRSVRRNNVTNVLCYYMSDENIQKYKKPRRNTKKTVSEARG